MKEPVVISTSIAGLISALLMWARLMDFIAWTDDQFNQTMIVVSLALPIIAGLFARSQTTELRAPKDEDGTPLRRADGGTPQAQARSMARQ